MNLKPSLGTLLFVLISHLTYCQSVSQTTVNQVPQTNNVAVSPQVTNQQLVPVPPPPPSQYPLVKVLDGDTVVVMTVQQGKDMNKKFLMFKEDIKAANKKIDTLTEANSFLTDYSNAIYIKNKDYEGSLKLLSEKSEKLILKSKSLEDTIKAMNDRLNFERIKVDLTKAETQGKFDLYKTTMEMRVEDYKYKLDREERRTKYVSTRSFIEGGLIVAVLGIAADMVHTYYFKK